MTTSKSGKKQGVARCILAVVLASADNDNILGVEDAQHHTTHDT